MSVFVSCSSCGAKLRAPDNAAGRTFKCPKCGDLLRAPTTTNGLPDSDFTAEPEEPEPKEQESLGHDGEPWFYGYLEKYAKILQILYYVIAAGIAVLATILFIMALVGAFSSMKGSGGFGVIGVFLSFLGWILSLVGIAAALLLGLVGVALLLLVVDVARNVRAIKKATATPPIPK